MLKASPDVRFRDAAQGRLQGQAGAPCGNYQCFEELGAHHPRKANPPKIAAQTINRSSCIGALRCAVQRGMQEAGQIWLTKCYRGTPADCADRGDGARPVSTNRIGLPSEPYLRATAADPFYPRERTSWSARRTSAAGHLQAWHAVGADPRGFTSPLRTDPFRR